MITTAPPLARSSTLRLAAAIVALFAVVFLIVFAVGWVVIGRDLEARERREVADAAAGLAALHAAGGAAALRDEVAVGARMGGLSGLLLGWAGADGARVGAMPAAAPGWRVIEEDDALDLLGDGAPERLMALTVDLGDGRLIVARDAGAAEEQREIFASVVTTGLAVAVALSALGAALFARRAEARIVKLSATLDAVAAGDLAARAPAAAADGDDLDRVAAALNATLDRLEANVASLRQVSADIAHELRTPIQRLRGTLEALAAREGLDAEAAAVADDAIAQADAVARTFRALLGIAQIEAGGPRARFAPVDLGELAQAVADAYRPDVEDAGGRLTLSIAAPATVQGERDLLAQALANLVENALRHCPAPAAIEIALGDEAGRIALSVADRGPGVPAAERARVLRRFERLERSRATEGSGLGLALVAAVAELHGGAVDLRDNRPGLRAVLLLPAATR